MTGPDDKFLPGQHELDAYGNNGFRFGGMSHRGSILLLPSGVRAWPLTVITQARFADFSAAAAEAGAMDLMIIGTGVDLVPLQADLLAQLRGAGLRLEVMNTPTAARTYNFLVSEGRRAAAALIAVP